MEDNQDISQDTPTQEQPPIKKLYDGLYKTQRYTKSFDEFKVQYSTKEAISKLHKGLANSQSYAKGEDEFVNQYFPEVKKKETPSTPSQSLATPLPSARELASKNISRQDNTRPVVQMQQANVIAPKNEKYIREVAPIKKKEATAKREADNLAASKNAIVDNFNAEEFLQNDVLTEGKNAVAYVENGKENFKNFAGLSGKNFDDAIGLKMYYEKRDEEIQSQLKSLNHSLTTLKENKREFKKGDISQSYRPIVDPKLAKEDTPKDEADLLNEITLLKDKKNKLQRAIDYFANKEAVKMVGLEDKKQLSHAKRFLMGDKTLEKQQRYEEKGIPIRDEDKLNDDLIGLGIINSDLEERKVNGSITQEEYDDAKYNIDEQSKYAINKYPELKSKRIGLLVAQELGTDSRDAILAASMGDEKALKLIADKTGLSKKDLSFLKYGDIVSETFAGNIAGRVTDAATSLVTGALRLANNAVGVDEDRLSYINEKIGGLGAGLFGSNPYQQTQQSQSLIGKDLQEYQNPNAGKYNYNAESIKNFAGNAIGGLVGFIGGTKGLGALGMSERAALWTSVITSEYEPNYQLASEVMGKDATELQKNLYALGTGAIHAAAFEFIPKSAKQKLGIASVEKNAAKELQAIVGSNSIKELDKELLKGWVEKTIDAIAKSSGEAAKVVAATKGGALATRIVNAMVGSDEYQKENLEALAEDLDPHKIGEEIVGLALPLGLMGIPHNIKNSLQYKEGLYDAGLRPESYKTVLKQMVEDGRITEKEAEQRNEVIDVMANLQKSIPQTNPTTNEKLTHNQKVEYAYNRAKEIALKAKKEEIKDDVALSQFYDRNAKELVEERKSIIDGTHNEYLETVDLHQRILDTGKNNTTLNAGTKTDGVKYLQEQSLTTPNGTKNSLNGDVELTTDLIARNEPQAIKAEIKTLKENYKKLIEQEKKQDANEVKKNINLLEQGLEKTKKVEEPKVEEPISEVDTKLSVPIEGTNEQGVPIGENVPAPIEKQSGKDAIVGNKMEGKFYSEEEIKAHSENLDKQYNDIVEPIYQKYRDMGIPENKILQNKDAYNEIIEATKQNQVEENRLKNHNEQLARKIVNDAVDKQDIPDGIKETIKKFFASDSNSPFNITTKNAKEFFNPKGVERLAETMSIREAQGQGVDYNDMPSNSKVELFNKNLELAKIITKDIGNKVAKGYEQSTQKQQSGKDVGEDTQGAGGGKEPPKIEDGNLDGDGKKGITHAAIEELRKLIELPEYEGKPIETHIELIKEAQETIKNNPNAANESMSRMEDGGKVTNKDNAVLAVYKATIDAEMKVNPTKELLERATRLSKALDFSGTDLAKALESRKLIAPEDNLTNFLLDKQSAQGTALTESQIKSEAAKYAELKEAKEALEKQLEIEREQHKKDIAELGINKAKAKARKDAKKSDVEYKKERQDALNAAKAALEKLKSQPKNTYSSILPPIPYADKLVAIAPHLKDYFNSIASQGVDKLDNIISKVHAEFKDILEELTKKDVLDIVGGAYNESKKGETRNEKANNIRLIEREIGLLKELERARKGEDKAKTEKDKVASNRRIDELKEKIKEVRRLNKNKENEDLESPKDATDGEIEYNIKLQKKLTEKAQKLIEDIKNKKYLEEKEPEPVFKKTRKTQLLEDKVIDLENKIRHDRSQDTYNKRGKLRKAFDKVMEVLGIRRLVQSALDMSVPFRQGATLLSPRKIDVWLKGYKANLQSIFSPKRFERVMHEIRNDPMYHEMVKDNVVFNDLGSADPNLHNEDFRKSFVYKIPILSEPLKASNRSADAFLNVARLELYKKLRENLEKRGLTRESDPKAFKYIGNWTMAMTGRGTMHSALEKPAMNAVLGNTFYGARLMASRFNLLNPVTYFDPRIPKEAKREAMKDMAAFTLTMISVGTVLSYTTGAKISLDPDDSDFLQLRYGKKVYDISGGLANYVRTSLRILKSGYTKATGTKYEGQKATDNAGKSTLNFFRNKLSPNTAYGVDAFFGGRYGNEFDKSDIYKIMPMYTDDFLKAIKEEGGLMATSTVLLPNILGIGYGSYASKGQIDANLEDLLKRNLRSDEMNNEKILNHKEGGRVVTFDEFNNYADKRDEEIESKLKVVFEKGIAVIDENGKAVTIDYKDIDKNPLYKEELVKEINRIKTEATKKVKEELFGIKRNTGLDKSRDIQKERLRDKLYGKKQSSW